MALLDAFKRDIAETEPRLPLIYFAAYMREVSRGALTVASMKSFFNLDATAQSNLDALVSMYQSSANKTTFLEVLEDCLRLAEAGVDGYQTSAAISARLVAVG